MVWAFKWIDELYLYNAGLFRFIIGHLCAFASLCYNSATSLWTIMATIRPIIVWHSSSLGRHWILHTHTHRRCLFSFSPLLSLSFFTQGNKQPKPKITQYNEWSATKTIHAIVCLQRATHHSRQEHPREEPQQEQRRRSKCPFVWVHALQWALIAMLPRWV